jgi:ribonuclease P/MRP protein subunit POP5
MVRIKHRYLLLNILFPGDDAPRHDAATPPYLTFHHPSPSNLHGGSLIATLRASIATHFGDVGAGLAAPSLKVIYFSPTTSTAIVRCPRQHFRLVWAALTYMTSVPGEGRGQTVPCVVQVVRVSGTIRKSEDELILRSKRDIVRAKEWEQRTGAGFGALSKIMGGGAQATGIAPARLDSVISEDEDDMDYD